MGKWLLLGVGAGKIPDEFEVSFARKWASHSKDQKVSGWLQSYLNFQLAKSGTFEWQVDEEAILCLLMNVDRMKARVSPTVRCYRDGGGHLDVDC